MENQLKNWNINETNVENIWKVHGYNMENCITWWNIFDNYITITKNIINNMCNKRHLFKAQFCEVCVSFSVTL